jgi:acyl-coenzyme A thioesterase PaaI-like protein
MEETRIGQAPDARLVELAESLRSVANRLLRVHQGSHEEVERSRAMLDQVDERLARIASEAEAPRMVEDLDSETTRPYYFPGALAPRVHVAHPWMTAEEEEGGRRGRVRFDLIHEGPPGLAHGGHVAWFFDQAFGQLAVALRFGGPTHRLEVTYRQGTPLHEELDYSLRTTSVEGRKLFAEAELRHGDRLLAEAKALFVAPRSGLESSAPA